MAVDSLDTYIICPRCKGRKVVDVTDTTPEPDDPEPGVTQIECPRCTGEGEVEFGRVDSSDMSDRIDDFER